MRSLLTDVTRTGLLALGLAVGLAPALHAQELRDVVSKEVAVARDEAELRLEVAEGGSLAIALTAGRVLVDDQVVGSYEPGSTLEVAWRTLLGTAVALENGPLARALVAWSPPDGLEGAGLEVAQAVDQALERALTVPEAPTATVPPMPAVAPNAPGGLSTLLGRTERLRGLALALEGLDLDGLHLTVGEDLEVADDAEFEGTVVVVDGDLELAGLIRGDAVVLGGDVVLRDGGRITGALRHSEGRVLEEGGLVEGGITRIDSEAEVMEREIRDRIREEVRTATREGVREATRGSRGWGPLERVGRGIGGAIGNVFTALILGLVGGLALYFAGPRMDAVAETVRMAPGRSAMVGAAGAFLVLPAWVLGIIALAISIIGIPALILWIPLFPMAVIAAAALGYLAVARNLGVWLSRQDYPYMDWVRVTNPYSLVFGGVLVLMAAFMAGNLLSMVPFLGALRGLLFAAGTMATVFAVLAGFGAVILTRGGRPNEYWSDDFFSSGGGTGSWDDLDPTTGPAGSGTPTDPGAGAEATPPAEPEATAETPESEPWNPSDA